MIRPKFFNLICPGALLFNAGCNEQVFSSRAWKKFGTDRFREKRKKRTFNSEKWRQRAKG